MNKRGLTLIELMIVIAILGIVGSIKYFYTIKTHYDFHEEMVFEQEKVIKFYKTLKKLLAETKEFKTVKPNLLIADNFRLSISNDRTKIKLNERLYDFRSFKMLNFRRDEKIVICDVKNGKSDFFTIYLIAGNSHKAPDINNANEADKKINGDEGIDANTKSSEGLYEKE